MKKKFIFYSLSFTWGLPMTLIGCLVAAVLMLMGKRPKKFGLCWYFEFDSKFGGLNLGPIFLTDQDSSGKLKAHEVGHAIQNIRYGLLMPFIVGIPSVVRYWYRALRNRAGNPCTTGYYDIWFEAEANKLGYEAMAAWKNS